MNIFQKVTFKMLKENKTRTIVTIIGIILSLSMFTAVTTSVSSFRNYLLEVSKIREGNWHGAVPVSSEEMDSLLSDKSIDSVSFLEHIGYVWLKDSINEDKPYLFIGGMDESAFQTLPLILTDGRMPQNDTELLIPAHLSYNGGITFTLNEHVTLKIGDRISMDASGNSYSLNQNTPYLYTTEELMEQGYSDSEISSRDTEYFSPHFSRTYTIVGFYERPAIEPYTAPGYTALTMSSNISQSNTNYTAYIRFKKPKDAIPWLEKNYPDSADTNSDLLRLYTASYESSYNKVIYGMAVILIFIILFGSISLIYNAFSISVTERTKQFGLLSSLGATKKQLIHSVLFEAFLLCVIGIPLGILAGVTGIGITFSLLGASLGASISDILWREQTISLSLHVSPSALLCAVLLGLFTVLISAYLPARRSAKLSPIDAIRMTADIYIRPGKVKTSRLTYRLFGLPGVLASKNFKRNRKKYRITVVSLFVSIVLFISASSFCSYLVSATENILSDSNCDIAFYRHDDLDISNDEILEQLASLDGISKSAWIQSYHTMLYLEEESLNPKYRHYFSETDAEAASTSQGKVSIDAIIYFINDSSYQAYLQEAGLSPKEFMDIKQPIAVVSDFYRIYNTDTGKYTTFHLLNDTSTSPLNIGAVADTVPFFLGEGYSNFLLFLYPASAMDTIFNETLLHDQNMSSSFYFMAQNHEKAAADISKALSDMGLDYGSVYDYAQEAASDRTLLLIITVFSYGFIILISLIAIAKETLIN